MVNKEVISQPKGDDSAGGHHPEILRSPIELTSTHGKPLFGEITDVKGLLNRQVRSKVDRVVLVGDYPMRLS